MDKQRIDAIRVELSTVADDIQDFIDEVIAKLAKLKSSEQATENLIMS